MANLTLYIDTSKSPINNPVLSVANNTPDDSTNTFVVGDKTDINFVFVKSGVLDTSIAKTGSLGNSFQLALGYPGQSPLYSTKNFYISQSNFVSSSLDLTGPITGNFVNLATDYITPSIQLSVYTPSGSANRRTYLIKPTVVYNAVSY